MKTSKPKKAVPERTSKPKPKRNAAQEMATMMGIPVTITSSAGLPVSAVPAKRKPTKHKKKLAK